MAGVEVGAKTKDVEAGGSDVMLRFIMTLIVSTLMVAVTAYVLSYAVLAPDKVGSAHGGAVAILRAHS